MRRPLHVAGFRVLARRATGETGPNGHAIGMEPQLIMIKTAVHPQVDRSSLHGLCLPLGQVGTPKCCWNPVFSSDKAP